jgi:hypothetical protein
MAAGCGSRVRISAYRDRPFRSIVIACFGPSGSLISEHHDRRFRAIVITAMVGKGGPAPPGPGRRPAMLWRRQSQPDRKEGRWCRSGYALSVAIRGRVADHTFDGIEAQEIFSRTPAWAPLLPPEPLDLLVSPGACEKHVRSLARKLDNGHNGVI